MKKESVKSYGMLVTAMLIFGTIGLLRRSVPLSSGMIACVRGFLGAGSLWLFVRWRRGGFRRSIGKKQAAWLVLSGGLMGFNWIMLFEAYNYTSVATATLCYYMAPTLVILLSPALCRERLTLKKGLCAAAAVAGMVPVSGVLEGNGIGSRDLTGVFLGLGAAVLYALVVLLNKKVQVEDVYEKTVIQIFSAAVILLPYLAVTEDFAAAGAALTADAWSVVPLLAMGLVHTGLAYALYFGSIKGLRAQSVAVISYIDPVSALLFSALFLRERLTLWGTVGAVLVVGAAFVSELQLGGKKE